MNLRLSILLVLLLAAASATAAFASAERCACGCAAGETCTCTPVQLDPLAVSAPCLPALTVPDLAAARAELAKASAPAYIDSLRGTLGRQPL